MSGGASANDLVREHLLIVYRYEHTRNLCPRKTRSFATVRIQSTHTQQANWRPTGGQRTRGCDRSAVLGRFDNSFCVVCAHTVTSVERAFVHYMWSM